MNRKLTHDEKSWYKYISKNDYYEKSVSIKGEFSRYEFNYHIEPRLIYYNKIELLDNGMIYVDGFYRGRSDKYNYYPVYGKYGIPDRKKSNISRFFERHLSVGRQKHESKIKAQKEAEWQKEIEENEWYRKNLGWGKKAFTGQYIPRHEVAYRLGIKSSELPNDLLEIERKRMGINRLTKAIKKLAV